MDMSFKVRFVNVKKVFTLNPIPSYLIIVFDGFDPIILTLSIIL